MIRFCSVQGEERWVDFATFLKKTERNNRREYDCLRRYGWSFFKNVLPHMRTQNFRCRACGNSISTGEARIPRASRGGGREGETEQGDLWRHLPELQQGDGLARRQS